MNPTYRYCPRCATPLEPYEGHPYRRRCPACEWIYWGNAKPTACALVERAGPAGPEVLLVRRAIEPALGKWDIPGGFIDLHEGAEEAMCRELLEETGLVVEAQGILGIWPDEYPYGDELQRTLNIVYRATAPVGATPYAADDASEVAWFAASALPPADELAFASCVAALQQWQVAHDEVPC